MELDPTQCKPAPMQTTLLLVNQFIVQTTTFLNTFANTVETKICKVSSRVTELEILMSVFEAKLNSIAGVPNYDAAALPDTAAPSNPTPASAPASAPAASSAPVSSGAPAVVPPPPQATVSAPEPSPVGPMVKDHPDYAPFFKMLKVGVPQPVIVGKMSAIGLNPALLDTPDAPAPSDGGSGDID